MQIVELDFFKSSFMMCFTHILSVIYHVKTEKDGEKLEGT